jgi:hypothetical protein
MHNERNVFNWQYILIPLILVYVLPVWFFHYFPTLDGPSHVANSALIKNMVLGSCSNLTKYLEFTPAVVPNWTGFVLLGFFQLIVSPLIAEKILITLYIILFITSSSMLLRKINPSAGFFIIPIALFSYNTNLFFGNYNFLLGVALYLLFLNWLIIQTSFNGFRFYLKLTLISLVLYLTHFLGLAFFFISIFCILTSKFRNKGISLKSYFQQGLGCFICLIPCIILFIQYYLLPKLPIEGGMSIIFRISAIIHAKFLHSFSNLEVLPIKIFSLFIWICVTLAMYYSVREKIKLKQSWFFLQAILFVLIILLAPASFAGGWSIQERLSIMIFLSLIFWLANFNYSKPLKTLLCLAFILTSIIFFAIKINYIYISANAIEHKIDNDYAIKPNSTFIITDLNPFDLFVTKTESKIPLATPTSYLPALVPCTVELSNFHISEKNAFPIRYKQKFDTYENLGQFRSINSIWFIPPKLTLAKFKTNTGELPRYVLISGDFANVHKLEPIYEEMTHTNTESLLKDYKAQLDSYYVRAHALPSGNASVYRIK